MFNKHTLGHPQTFVVTRETSNCPLITDMTRLGAHCTDLGIPEDTRILISYDYGRRLLTTAEFADAKTLHQEDVVEIVDYNPLKDILMIIGPKNPTPEAPVQWMIQKARHDINITLQINNPTLADTLPHTIPRAPDPLPTPTIDKAKAILKTLHQSPIITLPGTGALLIGVNAKAIENLITTHITPHVRP
jgi:hypothetical protein